MERRTSKKWKPSVVCCSCHRQAATYVNFVCVGCKGDIHFCHSCYNVLYKTDWPPNSTQAENRLPENVCDNIRCYEVYNTIAV